MSENFTVWVGGVEVNDSHLNIEQAQKLADQYILDGYDDVFIETINNLEATK
jgi:hypothetical protein